MNQDDFEGSAVLEQLATIGKVDDFFAAVDADDFAKARRLMLSGGIDDQTIEVVITQMLESEEA